MEFDVTKRGCPALCDKELLLIHDKVISIWTTAQPSVADDQTSQTMARLNTQTLNHSLDTQTSSRLQNSHNCNNSLSLKDVTASNVVTTPTTPSTTQPISKIIVLNHHIAKYRPSPKPNITSSRYTTTTRKSTRYPKTTPYRRLTTKLSHAQDGSDSSKINELAKLEELANTYHTTRRPYDAKRDCGVRPMKKEGRVVGGRDSHLGELPWSVLIRETTLLGIFAKTKCGGVLIDLKWVLTAAHCQPGLFGSLVVVVGEYDLAGRTNRLRPVIKKVKRMIVHRDYNPNNFDNDIALLELESPFILQPHVVPICLPDKDEEFVGQLAQVAGWGKLSFGGPVPSVLQVARLPVIGNKQCQEMYHNSGHIKIISDSFLCAGYANGGLDSCEGDSGGPLQVQRAEGKWVLVGIVSHGIKCAEPNLPGIYIRSAAYLPWIRSVIAHQEINKRLPTTTARVILR